MGENKVDSEKYVVLQGWMLCKLGLKGNELVVYAIIYGFSQAENQVFNGSLQYLADWTNSSKQSVMKCLKSLTEKKLIAKNEKYINGVKFCEYYATKFNGVYNKVAGGIQQSCIGGIQQSCTNNIDIDNTENNIEDNKKERKKSKKKESNYDLIINEYTDNEELKTAVYEFIKMRQLTKKPLTDHALKLVFKELDKLSDNEETKILILNQSISRSWQGVFPLKDNSNTGNNNNTPPKTQNYGITI